MGSIYLVRHGESAMNVTPRLSHRLADLPLTERGLQQARLVAGRLAKHPPVRIFTGPLRRARETADCIGELTGAPVRIEESLREIDCGTLDGRGDDDAWEFTREIYRRWNLGDQEARFPGGESYQQLYDRLAGLLTAVMARWPHDDIVMVGHGGQFGFVLPRLCALPTDSLTALLNTSVTMLRHHEQALSCELWGCVVHLGEGESAGHRES